MEYEIPLGLNDAAYLKHYIKYDELKNFLIYLKKKGNIQLIIIFEILYKFGVRVGAISKLKVKDLSDDGILIFHEKNKKVIKRKLKLKLFEKLKKLIKLNFLKEDDYIFFPHLNIDDEDERAKAFSNLLTRHLKDSKCFEKKENETISPHMFRASHAINIFKKYGLDLAAKELNHTDQNTTNQNYIKIEDRDLLLDEEEKLFDIEIDIILNGPIEENKNNSKTKKLKKQKK